VADIFREVEEDVRRERYAQLWKKYGDYAVALAAAVVIGVSGFELYQRYEAGERTKASDQFIEATVAADPSQAADMFAHIASTAPDGIRARANAMATYILSGGDKDVGTVPPMQPNIVPPAHAAAPKPAK